MTWKISSTSRPRSRQILKRMRPTPLLLRYETGGYNCLHQDLYGSVAFPLQVAVLLSQPGVDFEGGEFLLVEGRPRMQSRGHAVALEQGQAIVFPNAVRPAQGVRGWHERQLHTLAWPGTENGDSYTL